MSREYKIDALNAYKRECRSFFDNIYKDSKKSLVFGEGDTQTPLILIGEAPGEQETLKKRPFVGRAGKNLDEFLKVLQLEREDIYITNVVKFRPYKKNEKTGRLSNRPPTRKEVELSRPWLKKEIQIILPQVIVTLGNTALRAILDNKDIKIGDAHGRPLSTKLTGAEGNISLFPLYHPASIIYRRELADVYREDLLKLKKYIEDLTWT